MFEHLDLYQVLFDYLTQSELLNIILLDRTFYEQICKYLSAKLLQIRDTDDIRYACRHNLVISLALSDPNLVHPVNSNIWNFGIEQACIGGHKNIIDFLFAREAWCWWWGLNASCEVGNREMAKFMIEKSKDYIDEYEDDKLIHYLNGAMWDACDHNQVEMIKFLVEKGANKCTKPGCRKSIEGHLNAVKND